MKTPNNVSAVWMTSCHASVTAFKLTLRCQGTVIKCESDLQVGFDKLTVVARVNRFFLQNETFSQIRFAKRENDCDETVASGVQGLKTYQARGHRFAEHKHMLMLDASNVWFSTLVLFNAGIQTDDAQIRWIACTYAMYLRALHCFTKQCQAQITLFTQS